LRFAGSIFIIVGTAITVLTIKVEMGLVVLLSTVVLIILTRILSPLLKSTNAKGLKSTSNLSSQIQEDLTSFKVIVTSNKRDLLAETFNVFNRQNYRIGLRVDLLNQTLKVFYDAAGYFSLLLVIIVGLKFVLEGNLSIGIMISYITYTQKFYDPLRQIAQLWSNVQLSFAATERVQDILSLKSNLDDRLGSGNTLTQAKLLELKDVNFGYTADRMVLKDINLEFEEGKTYALVGPTGGGKSTTASIIARLYDPTTGEVLLKGKNIKEYTRDEVAKEIGFILQDPFIFSGTIEENIKYGNDELKDVDLKSKLTEYGLDSIVERFSNGLDEKIDNQSVSISLGQKQIIAFIRAILRNPSLLILDEATANIDTVTENILEEILEKLPKKTTKIIIAHRLNTIAKSDQIIFISGGKIQKTSNFEDAKELILHAKRTS
jgi:ATP-binding cassette subfamily B protein